MSLFSKSASSTSHYGHLSCCLWNCILSRCVLSLGHYCRRTSLQPCASQSLRKKTCLPVYQTSSYLLYPRFPCTQDSSHGRIYSLPSPLFSFSSVGPLHREPHTLGSPPVELLNFALPILLSLYHNSDLPLIPEIA